MLFFDKLGTLNTCTNNLFNFFTSLRNGWSFGDLHAKHAHGEQNICSQLTFEGLVFAKAENIFIYCCDFFQFSQSVGGENEIKVKDQLYFYSKMLILPAVK